MTTILAGMLILPDTYGELAYLEQLGELSKGVNHKYIKKYRGPGGKWVYVYSVGHAGGVGHHDHMVEGAKFKAHGGHYQIASADGDHVTIKHDESGKTRRMSKAQLAELLHKEHAEAIGAHRSKIKRDLAAARKHGSKKQIARMEAHAKRHGVETGEGGAETPEKRKAKRGAPDALTGDELEQRRKAAEESARKRRKAGGEEPHKGESKAREEAAKLGRQYRTIAERGIESGHAGRSDSNKRFLALATLHEAAGRGENPVKVADSLASQEVYAKHARELREAGERIASQIRSMAASDTLDTAPIRSVKIPADLRSEAPKELRPHSRLVAESEKAIDNFRAALKRREVEMSYDERRDAQPLLNEAVKAMRGMTYRQANETATPRFARGARRGALGDFKAELSHYYEVARRRIQPLMANHQYPDSMTEAKNALNAHARRASDHASTAIEEMVGGSIGRSLAMTLEEHPEFDKMAGGGSLDPHALDLFLAQKIRSDADDALGKPGSVDASTTGGVGKATYNAGGPEGRFAHHARNARFARDRADYYKHRALPAVSKLFPGGAAEAALKELYERVEDEHGFHAKAARDSEGPARKAREEQKARTIESKRAEDEMLHREYSRNLDHAKYIQAEERAARAGVPSAGMTKVKPATTASVQKHVKRFKMVPGETDKGAWIDGNGNVGRASANRIVYTTPDADKREEHAKAFGATETNADRDINKIRPQAAKKLTFEGDALAAVLDASRAYDDRERDANGKRKGRRANMPDIHVDFDRDGQAMIRGGHAFSYAGHERDHGVSASSMEAHPELAGRSIKIRGEHVAQALHGLKSGPIELHVDGSTKEPEYKPVEFRRNDGINHVIMPFMRGLKKRESSAAIDRYRAGDLPAPGSSKGPSDDAGKQYAAELRQARVRKGATVPDDLLDGLMVLPDAYGVAAYGRQRFALWKGAAHKYIKKYRGASGRWVYVYHVGQGGGVAHHEHMVEGSAFRADGGHYHVTSTSGDHVTIKHDESGKSETLTREELASKLKRAHGAALQKHHTDKHARLKRDLERVQKYGTDKQKARIQREHDRHVKQAEAHGVDVTGRKAGAKKPTGTPGERAGKLSPEKVVAMAEAAAAESAQVEILFRNKRGITRKRQVWILGTKQYKEDGPKYLSVFDPEAHDGLGAVKTMSPEGVLSWTNRGQKYDPDGPTLNDPELHEKRKQAEKVQGEKRKQVAQALSRAVFEGGALDEARALDKEHMDLGGDTEKSLQQAVKSMRRQAGFKKNAHKADELNAQADRMERQLAAFLNPPKGEPKGITEGTKGSGKAKRSGDGGSVPLFRGGRPILGELLLKALGLGA